MTRRRSRRLLALLAFRDERRYLPDWLANVSPHVDGIVALDDGSADGSAELLARHPAVLRILRNPPRDPDLWNDAENHRALVEAAWEHDPDWLVGVDADERLERHFRVRAERELDRADREGHLAYRLVVREIWDHPLTYRSDGIWGAKSSARLFRSRRDHEFHMQRLHPYWAPLNSRENGDFPTADLILYHLRMVDDRDRRARRERYERLDPTATEQAIGYRYLTDETGRRLTWVPATRGYSPLPSRSR